MENDLNQKEHMSIKHDESEEIVLENGVVEVILPHLKKLWLFRKKLLIINGTITLSSAILILLFLRPFYDSSITILPDYGNKSSLTSALGGLASMAGIPIGGPSDPADVYQNLLSSESVVGPVIYSKYKTLEYSDSVNLIQYYDISADNNLSLNLRERKMFIETFQELTESVISVKLDASSRIIKLTVRMPESQLSADVANKLVESLDTYVRTKRKSNASIQRFYIEKRVSQVKDSLTKAENDLLWYRQANRGTTQSNVFILEESRLSRNVIILQTVYSDLMRQLETSKIEEIRDAPVLNIRDLADNPVIKSGPKRLQLIILIILVSFILSIVYILHFEKFKIFLKLFSNQS